MPPAPLLLSPASKGSELALAQVLAPSAPPLMALPPLLAPAALAATALAPPPAVYAGLPDGTNGSSSSNGGEDPAVATKMKAAPPPNNGIYGSMQVAARSHSLDSTRLT